MEEFELGWSLRDEVKFLQGKIMLEELESQTTKTTLLKTLIEGK